MQQFFHVNIDYKSRERRILNALLALVTGILTLSTPSFLYLIAGGYLVALGLVFMYARTPAIIAAFPILTGILIFIFPELMYSLVLANIMSPLLWRWREDPWFEKMKKLSPYRRVLRLKQYLMDNFTFNLDLDTWGLTTKPRELQRFSEFVDEGTLAQSNALFGYEGDKYYFDIDIRRHFGLDKYTTDIIPYWKTETIEAMNAFRHKEEYPTGAGECVSLAALYAASLFVNARIPLEDIYMMATPLHSQNFVAVRDGVLTNNRRIVTKNMWFNGSEITAKAQRALRNERVTVVVNNSGYIHTIYDEATISPESYDRFSSGLRSYLQTDIDFSILTSFLRQRHHLQKCFQLSHKCCGKPRYIEAEKIFHYEHGSKARVSDDSRTALLHEIDEDEFYTDPLQDRIMLDELEEIVRHNPISLDNIGQLKQYLHHSCYNVEEVVADLIDFCRVTPRLPSPSKRFVASEPVSLDTSWSRDQIIEYLESMRDRNSVADLAFAAYRDLARTPWKPFLKAALERNPVSISGSHDLSLKEAAQKLIRFPNASIYEGPHRLAQPDEVWNFGRGDGLEKALCLLNIALGRDSSQSFRLTREDSQIALGIGEETFEFHTQKELDVPANEEFAGIGGK